MPRKPPHPCPGRGHERCGLLVYTSRCPKHSTPYTHAEQQRMKRGVREWIAEHGFVCPGWGNQPAHPATDLTADHVVPMIDGGAGGQLIVRCRSCNSARGAARQ